MSNHPPPYVLRFTFYVLRASERWLQTTSWLLLAFFLFCSTAAASLPTTQEVEEALTCQCSCGLTVHSCNHLQCGFAVSAKQTIVDQVEPRGRGRRQHFLTVAGDKRRYDLFFPFTLADLLDDRLLGRHGKATLEVVATVDGQAAATLTSEGLLNLLGGGQGGRRCGAEEKERQRKPTRSLQPSLRRSESVK